MINKRVLVGIAVMGVVLWGPGVTRAASLEPSATPVPTMRGLNKGATTWSRKLPAAKRFALVLEDEAVLDKETGVVWQRAIPDAVNLSPIQARFECAKSSWGGRMGWRLPTATELTSLLQIDNTEGGFRLPAGHPFLDGPFPTAGANMTFFGHQSWVTDSGTVWMSMTQLFQQDLYPAWVNGHQPQTTIVWCVRG